MSPTSLASWRTLLIPQHLDHICDLHPFYFLLPTVMTMSSFPRGLITEQAVPEFCEGKQRLQLEGK